MKTFTLEATSTEPLDPDNFTGTGSLIRMLEVTDRPPVNAYRVSFEAGTRTAWHTHTGPQILVVLEGRCRARAKGGPAVELGPGAVISIPPGEEHWHGAAPDGPMVHLALNLDASTRWSHEVDDEEYGKGF